MNNPLDIIKLIKNPKEFVNNYMKQNSNPMLNNLIEMANKGDKQGLETFARNLFQQKGLNFDELMSQFK